MDLWKFKNFEEKKFHQIFFYIFFFKIALTQVCNARGAIKLLFEICFFYLLYTYFRSYTRKSGSAYLTLSLVFTPLKGDWVRIKYTVVLVLSRSINPRSCVPIGESGFAVFPYQ